MLYMHANMKLLIMLLISKYLKKQALLMFFGGVNAFNIEHERRYTHGASGSETLNVNNQ